MNMLRIVFVTFAAFIALGTASMSFADNVLKNYLVKNASGETQTVECPVNNSLTIPNHVTNAMFCQSYQSQGKWCTDFTLRDDSAATASCQHIAVGRESDVTIIPGPKLVCAKDCPTVAQDDIKMQAGDDNNGQAGNVVPPTDKFYWTSNVPPVVGSNYSHAVCLGILGSNAINSPIRYVNSRRINLPFHCSTYEVNDQVCTTFTTTFEAKDTANCVLQTDKKSSVHFNEDGTIRCTRNCVSAP